MKVQRARIWRLGMLVLSSIGDRNRRRSFPKSAIEYKLNIKWVFVFLVAVIGSIFIPGSMIPRALAILEETCPGICADGFYIAPNGDQIFTGAQANIELAWPQIGDAGYSSMRLGLKHTSLADANSDWSAEIGWRIGNPNIDTHRHVLAAWSDFNTIVVGGWHEIGVLDDTDANTYNYRVTEKKPNPSIYRWRFNGKFRFTKALTFQKTATVVCGGNTSSIWNAIGVAACLDVQYSSPDWSKWVLLPSHKKRVSPDYRVANMGPASWQSSGNNAP